MEKSLPRYFTVTAAVGVYIGLGFWLRPDPNTYLLLGIPITIAFQLAVARRPLRELWLRQAPFRLDRRTVLLFAALLVGPLWTLVDGLRGGSVPIVVYAVLAVGGAAGAAFALRVLERRWWRELAWMLAALAAVVAVRTATDGPGVAVEAVHSLLFYLPAVFVVEEVLFRGALDGHLHPADAPTPGWPSAAYVSLLWGLWHLPILDRLTVPAVAYVLAAQLVLGLALSWLWRRTGNLAAPGAAHALLDALRNTINA